MGAAPMKSGSNEIARKATPSQRTRRRAQYRQQTALSVGTRLPFRAQLNQTRLTAVQLSTLPIVHLQPVHWTLPLKV